MSVLDLSARIARHLEHARAVHVLDEELGTLHGLGWSDFVLLDALDTARGDETAQELGARLGMSRSQLLLRVLPLEKLGLVRRHSEPGGGERRVVLRPAGQRLLHEARETAVAVHATIPRG